MKYLDIALDTLEELQGLIRRDRLPCPQSSQALNEEVAALLRDGLILEHSIPMKHSKSLAEHITEEVENAGQERWSASYNELASGDDSGADRSGVISLAIFDLIDQREEELR